MAKRISLREYQEGMIARLQGVTATSQDDSRLGIEIAGERWLLDLADIAEVLPLPTIAPVALAQTWFRGVANIRGNLVSVVDLQSFFGGNLLVPTSFSRLLLLHARHLSHSGVLVTRMLGLRHLSEMLEVPRQSTDPLWLTARYQDESGCEWRVLGMAQLAAEPAFLRTGVIA
jgi:twitching motility protein PilI